ncbi:30S ribosomal subunit protein S5 [Candidatus Tremblaya phenacola PAVE]|nr:30S ribosomal subunit protein S5 [Candidatus Tremblaya phenacola PAVE]
MIEKVVSIRRVTKVVKGGRIMSFSALVVVGDGKGKVGIGKGRSRETSAAVLKATQRAYKNLIQVHLENGSIVFRTTAKFGASKVLLIPTKAGRGIVASDSVRTVLCAVGATDVGAKCFGSTNPINVVFATLRGLQKQQPKA